MQGSQNFTTPHRYLWLSERRRRQSDALRRAARLSHGRGLGLLLFWEGPGRAGGTVLSLQPYPAKVPCEVRGGFGCRWAFGNSEWSRLSCRWSRFSLAAFGNLQLCRDGSRHWKRDQKVPEYLGVCRTHCALRLLLPILPDDLALEFRTGA